MIIIAAFPTSRKQAPSHFPWGNPLEKSRKTPYKTMMDKRLAKSYNYKEILKNRASEK